MKLGLGDFWRTAKIILRKGKFTIPLLFNTPNARLCSSNKTNLCDENLSSNFNFDEADTCLPVFSCIIIKNYIIAITPKLVKVIINFDSSKIPGPDCIPVVVQKNFEHDLSYIPA